MEATKITIHANKSFNMYIYTSLMFFCNMFCDRKFAHYNFDNEFDYNSIKKSNKNIVIVEKIYIIHDKK